MEIFFSSIVLVLILIKYILYVDIILSWLPLFWVNFRPKFVSDIMDPIYDFIKKKIPTTIWMLDFTPIIIIFIIIFLISFLLPFTWSNSYFLIKL